MWNLSLLVFLSAFTLVVEGSQLAPAIAHAQNLPAIAHPTATRADDEPKEAKTFVGQVAQTDDGKFVLVTTPTKMMYLLDDQEKAKQFSGQNVKVTGTLDVATNTIHVEDIQGA